MRSAPAVGWGLLVVAFLAFVSLGLPDAVLGVAWPTMRVSLGREIYFLGVVLASGSAGYVLSSFSAGALAKRLGVGTVLLVSTLLATAGLVGYAVTPVFIGVCASAFLVGVGSGAIDACLNAFVAARLPPRYMSWLHGFYGVGATIGPALMTWAVMGGMGGGAGSGWRAGYAMLAGFLGGMSVVFLATRRAWEVGGGPGGMAVEAPARLGETLRVPRVWLQLTLFFLYCGIEVTAGQWLFSLLSEGRGRTGTLSGMTVTAYWAMFTAGRFVLGALTLRIPQRRILRWSMCSTPVVAALLWVGAHPWMDFAAAGLFGFAIAPLYPMLMSETADRVGRRHASHAIGMQVSAAVLGISVWPLLAGILASAYGLETVPVFLVGLCVAMVVLHEVGGTGDAERR